MSKDLISVFVIILVIVIGGLAYLLLPGRLNGPISSEVSTSTASSTSTTIIATSTNPSIQGTSTYEGYEPSAS